MFIFSVFAVDDGINRETKIFFDRLSTIGMCNSIGRHRRQSRRNTFKEALVRDTRRHGRRNGFEDSWEAKTAAQAEVQSSDRRNQ